MNVQPNILLGQIFTLWWQVVLKSFGGLWFSNVILIKFGALLTLSSLSQSSKIEKNPWCNHVKENIRNSQ